MENTKKVNPAKEPLQGERVKNTIGGASCPFWIFGDEDSAKNDLDNAFEVVDDETKD